MTVPPTNDARAPLDMAPQIDHLRDLLCRWPEANRVQIDPAHLARAAGLLPSAHRRPEVVLASDVALELGAPNTASHSAVLVTRLPNLVHHATVWRLGPDLPAVPKGASLPFAQILILCIPEGPWPDPFALGTLQYLPHRLPGYMTRSIPGRFWVRVSLAARARGLTLTGVGAALMTAYRDTFEGVCAAEVLFATAHDAVSALAPLCLEAEVVAGRHRKLAISDRGDLDCAELTCDDCEEKPVCDGLRDMLADRRRTA